MMVIKPNIRIRTVGIFMVESPFHKGGAEKEIQRPWAPYAIAHGLDDECDERPTTKE
jgi:hypothetical protein